MRLLSVVVVTCLALLVLFTRPAMAAVCGGGTSSCGAGTSVTYGGQSLTYFGTATNGSVRSELWYLTAPPSGAANVVVTVANATDVAAVSASFSGVNQATPLGTLGSAIGTGTTPTVTATSAAGEGVVDVLGALGTTTPTTSSPQASRATSSTAGGTTSVVGAMSTVVGSGSTTMEWTIPSADWALAAAPVKASASLTNVTVTSFTAARGSDGVKLRWESGYEPRSLGFELYRVEPAGSWTELDHGMIRGDATRGASGSPYTWLDDASGAEAAVAYWLKDIDINGNFNLIGPVYPTPAPAGTIPRSVHEANFSEGPSAASDGTGEPGGLSCGLTTRSRVARSTVILALALALIASLRRRRRLVVRGAALVAVLVATLLSSDATATGGIAFDAASSGSGPSTTSVTFSHTVGTHGDRLLVVGVIVPATCKDLTSDANNCGSCGNACSTDTCSASACVSAWSDHLYGSANDGSLTVSAASTVVNTYTYATAASISAGATTLAVNSATGIAAYDEIMIVQMQGGASGRYEFANVLSVSGTTLTLTAGLANAYVSGTFDTTSAVATQVVRVPNYKTVTISGGGSITATAWTGYVGGIAAFRAKTSATVTGSINVDAKGFRGGAGKSNSSSYATQGESSSGKGASTATAANGAGGGGGNCTNSLHLSGGGGGGGYASTGSQGSGYYATAYGGLAGTLSGTGYLHTSILVGGGGAAAGAPTTRRRPRPRAATRAVPST